MTRGIAAAATASNITNASRAWYQNWFNSGMATIAKTVAVTDWIRIAQPNAPIAVRAIAEPNSPLASPCTSMITSGKTMPKALWFGGSVARVMVTMNSTSVTATVIPAAAAALLRQISRRVTGNASSQSSILDSRSVANGWTPATSPLTQAMQS